MHVRKKLGLVAVGIAVTALAGCGGSSAPNYSGSSTTIGSSSTNGNTPQQGATSSVAVYITDAFNKDYSHVWVTVYKIEGSADNTTYTSLYDNATGIAVDLTSLATTSQLLNAITVPAGSYRSTRITFGDHITLVPSHTGATINAPVDDKSVPVANGKAVVTVNTPANFESGKAANVLIDFDLPNFEIIDGKLKPVLKLGDPNKFKSDRKVAEIHGIVSEITANKVFKLTPEHGDLVTVNFTPKTEIINTSPGTNPALTNAQKVVVFGSVDPVTKVIKADRVRIDNRPAEGDSADLQVVSGVVAAIDATAQSLTITPDHSDGFQPMDSTVTVTTDTHTEFHQGHDTPKFAEITTGGHIVAAGDVDTTTHALAAKRVEVMSISAHD